MKCFYCRSDITDHHSKFYVSVEFPAKDGTKELRQGPACAKCIIDERKPLNHMLDNLEEKTSNRYA